MDTTKRRILSFGAHGDGNNSEAEIARAFERLGHKVIRLDERGTDSAKLVAACAEAKPALLIGAKFRITGADGFDKSSAEKAVAALDECRPHVGQIAVWIFDALLPEFSRDRWQWAQELAPAVDVFAATDGSATNELPNAIWLPQGSPDSADDDYGWPSEYAGDVVFTGTPYRERGELMHHLRARFGPRFCIVPGSTGREVRGRDLTALYRSYRICICPPTPTWYRYTSNRAITAARHGALVAMVPVPGMEDDGWRGDVNYLELPKHPASIAAKLEEHANRDLAWLHAIRLRGYELAKAKTYDARVAELLRHLDAKRQRVAEGIAPAEIVENTGSRGEWLADAPIPSSTQSQSSDHESSGSSSDD